MGGRLIDWTIDNEVTDELKGCPCPAGELVGDLRKEEQPNVPGVVCRITHEPLSILSDQSSLVHFCCNPEGGYENCPVWLYEKGRIERGEHSMGDEDEKDRANEQHWREDLTGSKYGDTSEMDLIESAVQEVVPHIRDAGMVEGRTGRGFAT